MKKIVIVCIILGIVMSLPMGIFAEDNRRIKLAINLKTIECSGADPFLDENNRVLVPVRFVSENMGAEVTWNSEKKSVTIQKGDKFTGTYLVLTVGEKSVLCNEQFEEELDTAPALKNNRVYVPIRFISEKLGAVVNWDDASSTVSIDTIFTHMKDFEGDWYPLSKEGPIERINIRAIDMSKGLLNIYFVGKDTPESVQFSPDVCNNVGIEDTVYNKIYNLILMKMYCHNDVHFNFRICDQTPSASGIQRPDFKDTFFKKNMIDKVNTAINLCKELHLKEPAVKVIPGLHTNNSPIFTYVQTLSDGRIQIFKSNIDNYFGNNKMYTVDLINQKCDIEDCGDKILDWDGLLIK